MKTKFTKNDLVDDTMVAYDYHLRKNTKRSKGFKLKQYWLNKDDVLAVFEGNRELTIKHRGQLINILDNERTTIIRKVQLIVKLFRKVLDSAVEELKVKK